MHPYLRLAGVLASSLRSDRLNPLDSSRLTLRVLPGDVEISRMNNGRYVTLMDLGRVDLTLRCGLLRVLVKNRWSPLVASLTIRYRRSLELGERYDLVTRIAAFDEKYWYMEQRFEVGGEVAALAYVKAIFRGPSGNVTPRQMLSAAGFGDIVSPPMPMPLRLWLASEDAMRMATKLKRAVEDVLEDDGPAASRRDSG